MHFDKRTRWHPDSWYSFSNLVMLRHPPNKVPGERYQTLCGVMVTKCPTTKKLKKGRNPHLMKHWGHAAWHGRYNPHPVSWASSTEFILYSQDHESIVLLRELKKQSRNVQLCNKWFFYNLSTDLILNVFQERLWGAVVISDRHASFLQIKLINLRSICHWISWFYELTKRKYGGIVAG